MYLIAKVRWTFPKIYNEVPRWSQHWGTWEEVMFPRSWFKKLKESSYDCIMMNELYTSQLKVSVESDCCSASKFFTALVLSPNIILRSMVYGLTLADQSGYCKMENLQCPLHWSSLYKYLGHAHGSHSFTPSFYVATAWLLSLRCSKG